MKRKAPRLFETTAPESDLHPAYRHIRDDDTCAEDRAYLESLWQVFKPHADRHFHREFQTKFPSRVWEMRLAATLQSYGFPVSSEDSGPDFRTTILDRTVWIEAIAPEAGERLAPFRDRTVGTVPDEQILRRYSYALEKKIGDRRIKSTSNASWARVKADDAFVVAISGSSVPLADLERNDAPRILDMLFARGSPIMAVPFDGTDPYFAGYADRPSIPRGNKEPIRFDFFCSDDFADVSAIVFSPHHVKNRPEADGRAPGDDFVIVHNPFAAAPLPRGRVGGLRVGREFWIEGGLIKRHDWRSPPKRPAWHPFSSCRTKRRTPLRTSRRGARPFMWLEPNGTVFVSRACGPFVRVFQIQHKPTFKVHEGWVRKKYLRRDPRR